MRESGPTIPIDCRFIRQHIKPSLINNSHQGKRKKESN